MRKIPYLFVVSLLGVAAFATPAFSEVPDINYRDRASHYDGWTAGWDTGFGSSAAPAYAYIGGGVQFLSLPDIKFTGKDNINNGFRRQTNSSGDWLDAGGALDFGFQHPFGWWGGHRVIVRLNGFWSNVEVGDTTRCTNTATTFCGAFDPTGEFFVTPAFQFGGPQPTLRTRTDRDTDYWGSQASVILGNPRPNAVKPNFYRNDFFLAGFDVRGIDQDNRLHGSDRGGTLFRYDETLDTTYTGGYIGFGGEYSFGFIPGLKSVGGFYDRLGIRTFVTVKGGLYNADTDYHGRFWSAPGTTKLSESENELAFIGTVSLEARKQVGRRTSLSLWTDYEYISSVPEMRYANDNHPTRIEDDDIFASRTTLRLNVGLGPDEFYPERVY